MDAFFVLILKVFPLYLLILLGFLAGRYLKVKKESIAPILIYILAPVVIFNSVITTKIEVNNLSLPVLFFLLACFCCFLMYKFAGLFWKDSHRNILAFTAGTGNVGYFGLPVAIALFGEGISGLIMLAVMGFVLYQNTLGFYITARGHFTAKAALLKVFRLPAVYAFIFAIILSLMRVDLGEAYNSLAISFKGAYTVLGMMLIGLGISGITEFKIDWKFTGVAFMGRFLVWPILIGMIIFLDVHYLHFWTDAIHKVMILMSIVPLAADTVSYATALNTEPEKSAVTVLLSTIFALVFIPLVVGLLGI